MKNVFFILLLFVSSLCKGQVFVTWYDSDTFDLLYGEYMDALPPCDTVITEANDTIHLCATLKVYGSNYAKPRFDPVNEVYYNAATPEEQELFEAQQEANNVPLDAKTGLNNRFTTEKTDAELDALYPQEPPFFLYCENIGDGILYMKCPNSWRIVQTIPND